MADVSDVNLRRSSPFRIEGMLERRELNNNKLDSTRASEAEMLVTRGRNWHFHGWTHWLRARNRYAQFTASSSVSSTAFQPA